MNNLTAKQCNRMIEYIEKKKRGENVGEFVPDYPKSREEAENWKYNYWDKQPVSQLKDNNSLLNIINPNLHEEYSKMKQKEIPSYSWVTFDLNKEEDALAICNFLNKNYRLGQDDKFRLFYTEKYLRWSLGEDHIITGIRAQTNNSIGAIVAGSIKKYQVFDKELMLGDLNYLCVHPKLCEKGLAPILGKEIMRRLCERANITIGSFTTVRYVPTPVCRTEFYHRPLNFEKLYNCDFVCLENNMTLDRAVSTHIVKYKDKYKTEKVTRENSMVVYSMFCGHQDKYNYYQKYSYEEFNREFVDNDVVDSFVMMDDKDKILDFFSYYKLPSLVVKNDQLINAVYMYMYTTLNVTILSVFKSAILQAHNDMFDVLNCTDIMENSEILYDNFSRFKKGSGYLYYNFYNLTCPEMTPQQICKLTL